MKKGAGLFEILIILIVIIVCFMCFKPSVGRKNPFEEIKNVNNQSDIIDEKVRSIEETKALRNRIEQNLQKGY
jgi:competence protein ComGC